MTKAGLGPALCTPVVEGSEIEAEDSEIEATVAALIESMHTPISSLLDGEERTVFVDEFDRFFRINGLTDMPVEYMQKIAPPLQTLTLTLSRVLNEVYVSLYIRECVELADEANACVFWGFIADL